jgi:tRNA(Ile)-lysidine synthase
MARAAVALERRAADVAARLARIDGAGDLILDRDGLGGIEADTQMRLLAGAIRFVAGGDYRPRAGALEAALDRAMAGGAVTLAGCRIEPEGPGLRVFRELAAVQGQVAATPGAVWDGRWLLAGPAAPGLAVGALGEDGLLACPDWRATGLKRASLIATPALRRGGVLVAAPLAGLAGGWSAHLAEDRRDFPASLMTH